MPRLRPQNPRFSRRRNHLHWRPNWIISLDETLSCCLFYRLLSASLPSFREMRSLTLLQTWGIGA